MYKKYKMALEDLTLVGALFIGSGVSITIGLVYPTYRLNRSMQKVKESTTKFLDAATLYFAPRATTEREIEAFRELARTREKYGV